MKSKDKGTRLEHETVEVACSVPGWDGKRVPLSGAVAGWKGDVIIYSPDGTEFKVECKARAGGFKQLYGWLTGMDLLRVRQVPGEREGLWIVPDSVMTQIMEGAWRSEE